MKRNLPSQYIIFFFLFIGSNSFAQQGEWTWITGSSGNNGAPVYGTQGTPDPNNTPASMYEPMEWTDHDGNFWLFGGLKDGGSEYNTMWKFDPSTEEWTWVRGNTSCCTAGSYGTQGVPSSSNMPGARAWGGWTWVDNNGDLWLYGGIGYDATGSSQVLSDLWRYNIASDEWTWMDGPNAGTVNVSYGTKGIPTSTTSPGARAESDASWVDDSNRLWLFGGLLYHSMPGGWSYTGSGNDMWMWDPNITEWTWMQGTQQINMGGMYGTKGVPDSSNYPSGRDSYAKWKDKYGDFYFFGGTNLSANWNDLWKYDWQTNVFTWISGPNTQNGAGTFGTQCVPDDNNIPPSRFENRCYWQDTCDNFWMSSGISDANGVYNDLWHYSPETNQWTWISGSNTANATGSYGTQGVSSPTNVPPARCGNVGWRDNDGNLWLFGGVNSFFINYKNDLWRYVLDPACPAISACVQQIPVIGASDTSLCEKFCIDFSSTSANNPVSWEWIFEGGSPFTSTEQNPTNICYDDPGTYDVTLITTDAGGNSDTLLLPDYIKVFQNPFAPTITQNGNVLTSSSATTYQWLLNGDTIPGATSQSYTIAQSGLYTVKVENENGCAAQSDIQAFLVGIDEVSDDFVVNVFGNPTSHEIIIEGSTSTGNETTIQLVNALGQVMQHTTRTLSQNFKLTMNVEGYAAGIYFLEYSSLTVHLNRKIIIQNKS